MRAVVFCLGVLLCLSIPYNAAAQSVDSLSSGYTQELNTRSLKLENILQRSLVGTQVLSRVYGNLTVREMENFKPQWVQEAGLSLNANKHYTSSLEWITEVEGYYFKDMEVSKRKEAGSFSLTPTRYSAELESDPDKRGQDRLTSSGAVRSGMEYRLNDNLSVQLLGGIAHDKRLEGQGSGISTRGLLQYTDPTGEYPNLEGIGKYNQYGDRQYYVSNIIASHYHRFGEAVNRLSAQWQQYHSDLFNQSDGTIFSRVDNTILVNNGLTTPVGNSMSGVYELSVNRTNKSYRNIDLGEERQWQLDNRFALQFHPENGRGEFYYRYAIRDRDTGYLVMRKVHETGGIYSHAFGQDSVTVRYSISKTQDDSPDTAEYSDEDELIHYIKLRGLAWLSDQTKITVDASMVLDHLVNLNSAKSAANNWNRVFRINPAVIWTPAQGWRNSASFTVIANYTVYDFEDTESGDIQSRAFRRWSAADTLVVPVSYNWSMEFAGRMDLEDVGRLVWDEFTQELFEERQSRYYSVAFTRKLWNKLELMAGYRIHYRFEDQFDQDVDGDTYQVRSRTYYATGPQFRLLTRDTRRFRMYVEGSLIHVEDSQRSTGYSLDTIYFSLSYLW